ncbi:MULTISPECIES: HAD-IB family hydrolase [Clostridium]|uniref:phosphoserine phosphatase n=1 Tax=Clostridium acetobutylicum (strain ATCC 824 / DSM 792 / JCM 1419 / IAM 19013 / LMG 5710 / NBRC 13948 / NRRL B-527 / VKM B-1787 / 2291 / W) TaxID=272562 RepID=Q97MD5_CLOAB|nr:MULTISPECIES: HAD-IB family hydrolase [Clostridium]AAK78244.1 Phosphoserine phosphatase related protein [Clostridium acetobutylicum ATCC 824]ADZ19310.1 Phosphoserine phosphatase related protein [Clostridium acetobutylicum EA 2018]AEI33405.1 phosphoserine phosphatase related protein [Clostridium acetobutylicum DSM 1731]AWV82051.1 HAD-IB family hydrolase [Clostridium acetobutylicum]MBC2396097.1 HAD-IB family hydrolase [Clostridium acetobutylicum]
MKAKAAFFDIDGTLYREGLISEVFKKLIKYEIIDEEKWYKEVRPEFEKWDNRKGDYDDYLLKMTEIYVDALNGLSKSQVEFIASQVVNQKGERVYTYTRDRIKWHKERGHKIITISGSPIELVRNMAEKYGFDDYRGAEYLLDENDVYTGEVIPMWDSKSKERAVHELEAKYNIDLGESYAYGDTSGDLTMLKMVGNPVCINPTKELVKEILSDEEVKNKIRIIVERKDMIYKISSRCLECDCEFVL